MLVWRFLARRQEQDIHTHPAYVGIVVLGLIWIVLLGSTGGNPVFELGIHVRGINPLLKSAPALETENIL